MLTLPPRAGDVTFRAALVAASAVPQFEDTYLVVDEFADLASARAWVAAELPKVGRLDGPYGHIRTSAHGEVDRGHYVWCPHEQAPCRQPDFGPGTCLEAHLVDGELRWTEPPGPT